MGCQDGYGTVQVDEIKIFKCHITRLTDVGRGFGYERRN